MSPRDERSCFLSSALSLADELNAGLAKAPKKNAGKHYEVVGFRFWSGQRDEAAVEQLRDPDHVMDADPTAFLPDSEGNVSMEDFHQFPRFPVKGPEGDPGGGARFDTLYYDRSTDSFWHANHQDRGPTDPMIVSQSRRVDVEAWKPSGSSTAKYDRQVFFVVLVDDKANRRESRR